MLWCPGVGWAGWRVGAERSLAFRVQKSWLQLGSCESTWECGLVENPTETGKSSATGVSLEHVMTAPSQGCGEAKVKKSRVILEQPSWPGVFYTCVKEGPCPPQLLTAPLQGKSPKSPSLFWLQSSNGSEGDLRITVKLHYLNVILLRKCNCVSGQLCCGVEWKHTPMPAPPEPQGGLCCLLLTVVERDLRGLFPSRTAPVV